MERIVTMPAPSSQCQSIVIDSSAFYIIKKILELLRERNLF